MIKKLRNRFILITMVSVTAVLSVIMVSINIINYSKISKFSDNVLEMLAKGDGHFNIGGMNEGKRPGLDIGITDETPFETRYFCARFNLDGEITSIDTGRIAAIDENTAKEYAKTIYESGDQKGYIEVYRFLNVATDDGALIMFVDCSRQLETANQFLFTSILISLGALLAVFVLIYLLSKKAILPIAKSYEKQKRFVTDAGHELKTPLTVISANNEMQTLDYGENECTKAIEKQIGKLTTMVKNLTMLAKMDESEGSIEKKSFIISDAVIDTVEPFIRTAVSKDKVVTTDLEEGIEFYGDEKLIRQLLGILMDNAIKYSLKNIDIKLFKLKGKTILIVENDCLAIEYGDLSRVFDRFSRTDTSRASDIEGSGIGLSIAKEIVEKHKGKIFACGKENNKFEIKVVF